MRIFTVLIMVCFAGSMAFAQNEYEPSAEHPYGLPNPAAPSEIKDFHPMIGKCDCKSSTRKKDGTWAEAIDMTWVFKYIMNGLAVQDETLKLDGKHSGSIRQFNTDSASWYVHYYASATPTAQLSAWKGGKKGDDIVLYKSQKAPNGMDGYYRLTFNNITEAGFNWTGAWVSLDESVEYPTWKIECTKQTE